jgi:hypothetical protein
LKQVIDDIRGRFARRDYEYSRHAVDQSVSRGISQQEIEEAVASGEVIEDYPSDKYGPSCLLFGTTRLGRPLHLQCTHPTRPKIKIITVYEPDPAEWIGYRRRRFQ